MDKNLNNKLDSFFYYDGTNLTQMELIDQE